MPGPPAAPRAVMVPKSSVSPPFLESSARSLQTPIGPVWLDPLPLTPIQATALQAQVAFPGSQAGRLPTWLVAERVLSQCTLTEVLTASCSRAQLACAEIPPGG